MRACEEWSSERWGGAASDARCAKVETIAAFASTNLSMVDGGPQDNGFPDGRCGSADGHLIGTCAARAARRGSLGLDLGGEPFWRRLFAPALPRSGWPSVNALTVAVVHASVWCAFLRAKKRGTVESLAALADELCATYSAVPSGEGGQWFSNNCYHGIGHGLFLSVAALNPTECNMVRDLAMLLLSL